MVLDCTQVGKPQSLQASAVSGPSQDFADPLGLEQRGRVITLYHPVNVSARRYHPGYAR